MYSLRSLPSAASQCPAVQPAARRGAQPPVARGQQTRVVMMVCRSTSPHAVMLEGAFAQQSTPGAVAAPVAVPAAQASAAQFPAILSATARSAEQVAQEVEQQLQLFPQALVQAVEPDMYASLRKLLGGVQYHARAKMLLIKPKPQEQEGGSSPAAAPAKQRRMPGMLCVVSAGPEDQAAADQVKLVAEHLGCFVTTKSQMSIRDLPGLVDKLPALQAADAVVAIAGADSSLPGAIAGLIDSPVIALPTSQCNSSGLGGLGGLVAAVSGCNLGVSAVGIDQPAAAAMMAARMLRVAAVRVERLTAAQQAAAAPVAAPAAAVPATNGNGKTAVNNVVPTMLDSLSLTPALAAASK